MNRKPLGLVACGGKSSRMGTDKSLIHYHSKAQRIYVYEILQGLCENVFLSLNADQEKDVEQGYNKLIDLPEYNHIGPMAAILTAFHHYPDRDFLMVGCDYPFLTITDLSEFTKSIGDSERTSAFYNEPFDIYEPLLAYYPQSCMDKLLFRLHQNHFSLQMFLKESNAIRYTPVNLHGMTSVDTIEDYDSARQQIILNNATP